MNKSTEIQSTREKKMLWNNPIIDEKISTFKTDELQLLLEATYEDLKDSNSMLCEISK
jgi:hypothetical protein